MSKERFEKVEAATPDLVKERIEELRKLFPEAFTEGRVDFEKLCLTLGRWVDARPERYTFSWAGKRDAIRLLQTPSRATLKPDVSESVDFDTTHNVFIEGENLEVLKLLYKPYFRRVKMIYIDPPYNTGDKRVYLDNYAAPLDAYLKLTGQRSDDGDLLTSNLEKSGRFHSAWLSMMYPRLFLARQLLRDDGVIFASIDDHEVHNLRMLMNEVYGEENFVGVMKRRAARKTAFLSGTMSDVCDYVVVYSKDKLESPLSVESVSENTRPVLNEGNTISERRIPEQTEARCADGVYKSGIYKVRTQSFTLLDDLTTIDGRTQNEVRVLGPFRVNQELLARTVYITKNFGLRRRLLEEEMEAAKAISDLVDNPKFYNEVGSEELRDTFGFIPLENPKPTNLIRYLIKASSIGDNDFTILDFFAGACPTAQAVLELNREDGGNRRFICVQLPEQTPKNSPARQAKLHSIADLGKERIRRVISRMKQEREGRLPNEQIEDLGFRVFKLDESNIKWWDAAPTDATSEAYIEQMQLIVDPLVANWQPADVIWEVALKEGYALTANIERCDNAAGNNVFRVTDKDKKQSFLICLDDAINAGLLAALGLDKDDLFICRDAALDDTLAASLALQCRLKTI